MLPATTTRRQTFPFARIAAAGWGAMILGGFVIGAVGPDSWRHALAEGGPGCPFKHFTGIDCPFCGMTRATLAMGGGDFHRALDFHPLAPIVIVLVLAVLAIIVAGKTELLLRGRRPWYLLGSILAIWALRLIL